MKLDNVNHAAQIAGLAKEKTDPAELRAALAEIKLLLACSPAAEETGPYPFTENYGISVIT
jgi:hypothetical protein